MKKWGRALSDFVLQRRWPMLVLYGTVAAVISVGPVSIIYTGNYSTLNLAILCGDMWTIGFLCAGMWWTWQLPGLFYGLREADRATVRAQVEEDMRKVWEHIEAEHREPGAETRLN